MTKFLAICRNTFIQTIRQPVYGILIAVTFAILVLTLSLVGQTLGESGGDYKDTDQQQLQNMGLGTLLVFSGLLMAAFVASNAISREIEDRTALTVISKPLPRAVFVLGKFAGVALAVALAYYLCSLVLLMTVRHSVMTMASDPYDFPVIVLGFTALGLTLLTGLGGNYFFGWHFTSACVWSGLIFLSAAAGVIGFIGKGWVVVPFGTGISPQLMAGIFLIFLGVMIFTAVAVAASTRLSQIMTLLVCLGFFALGTIRPAMDLWAQRLVTVRWLAWMIPDLTQFYSMDALSGILIFIVPASLAAKAGLYCLLYVVAILAIGIALFQTRQLEPQSSASTLPRAVGILAWAGRVTAAFLLLMGLEGLLVAGLPGIRSALGSGVLGNLVAPAGMSPIIPTWAAWYLPSGVLLWVLWGFFGRGVRWSYWVVLGLMVITLAGTVGRVLQDAYFQDVMDDRNRGFFILGAILEAALVGIMLLPKSRRHFKPV